MASMTLDRWIALASGVRRDVFTQTWWLAAVPRLNIRVEMVEYLGLRLGPPLQTDVPFPFTIERHEQRLAVVVR